MSPGAGRGRLVERLVNVIALTLARVSLDVLSSDRGYFDHVRYQLAAFAELLGMLFSPVLKKKTIIYHYDKFDAFCLNLGYIVGYSHFILSMVL